MEGTKGRTATSSSSSSFTAEFFGSKDPSPPSSSSSGIFSSMFPHPSKGSARDVSSYKHSTQGQRRESLTAREDRAEPCHLSSSLYYGGQDVYSRSTTNQTERPISRDDDANGQNSQDVSRGNWWQGSLYY
ncbi:unnamed protein product [Cochlearia groenlandica]